MTSQAAETSRGFRRGVTTVLSLTGLLDSSHSYPGLTSLCENSAAPEGFLPKIQLYPGLRCAPSWANCNSTPSGFNFRL
jgi:hypothetical protein